MVGDVVGVVVIATDVVEGHRRSRHRLDLGFFQSHGREATGTSRLGDLANGEREAFCHDNRSGDDDHLCNTPVLWLHQPHA